MLIKQIIATAALVFSILTPFDRSPVQSYVPSAEAHVTYSTHVQNIGWQDEKKDGETAGTSGKSYRLEGITINLDSSLNGSILYRTHVQNIGWQDWVSDGDMSGTSGRSLRLEAIQIKLSGDIADRYDIYYRVHCQNFGWMGWAKNGESAGSEGYSYRLEAIQIKLISKSESGPSSDVSCFMKYTEPAGVYYSTHIQNIGWQSSVKNGAMSGTSGKSYRLEGIKINLKGVDGGIRYRTHVQNIGWQDWVYDGEMSGTSGRSLRLEAIEIELTGKAKEEYDIYYRVHCQNAGWQNYAMNGDPAGTAGYGYRLEAIEINIAPKGTLSFTTQAFSFVDSADLPGLDVYGKIGSSSTSRVHNGQVFGSSGSNSVIGNIQVELKGSDLPFTLQCRTHHSNKGWQEWTAGSQTAKEWGNMQALELTPTGEGAKYIDVWYRVCLPNVGWLGWARNGQLAGTEGYGKCINAVQIMITKKGASAPGSTDRAGFVLETNSQGMTYVNGHLIANKQHKLPSTYAPGEDDTASDAAWDLVTDMRNLGYDIAPNWSGFRSYETQNSLYWSYVNSYGQASADTFSARAGYSEHQTGLAYDLRHRNGTLVTKTAEAEWIAKNAYKYGFIVRYQEGKESITGYTAEPWHLRYVGDIAESVYRSGMTLEEYFMIPGGTVYK